MVESRDFTFDGAAVAAGYGEQAEQYAADRADDLESHPFDRNVLSSVLRDVPVNGLVLDAGCGPGTAAASAQARGFRAVGLDITTAMLDIAQRRVPAVVLGDLRFLPFAAGAFDAVIAWFSLLHVPRNDVPGTLAGIRRVMRTGAPLLVALQGGRDQSLPSPVGWCDYQSGEIAQLLTDAAFTDVVARTRPPEQGEYPVMKVIVSAKRD